MAGDAKVVFKESELHRIEMTQEYIRQQDIGRFWSVIVSQRLSTDCEKKIWELSLIPSMCDVSDNSCWE